MMKAKIEIECKEPQKVINSIEPDMDQNEKFEAKLETDDNKIKLTVKSDEISGLLAGINSYLRLIKTTNDLEEIKND
ncbi:MAG: hypothetical protein KJ906_03050 [Nanoarchaeota archaeon]|nr:hypothetical protein [Nanoarchaeota archaeon]